MVSLLPRRRSPSPPSAEKQAKPKKAKDIPSGFINGVKTFSRVGSMPAAEKAQEAMLKRLPYFRTDSEPDPPYPSLVARQYKLHLSDGNFINTLEIKAVPKPGEPELVEGEANVLLHGYALGLGFFWKNWETMGEIAAKTGRRAFVLDWVGMGLSSRPHPKVFKGKHPTDKARSDAAEVFFLEPLLEFFNVKKITTAQIVGHSLGGYLTLAFALRHPERVTNLILLSPAGIPRHPEKESKADAKLEDAVQMETGLGPEEESEDEEEEVGGVRKPQAFKGPTGDSGRLMKSFYSWMWETNKSPLEVVRMMGPFGQMLLGKYSTHRFASLPSAEDRHDLSIYLANLISLPGSGEYSVASLLRPGAFARAPLLDRISGLGKDIGVVFAYGEKDWMDKDGGKDAVKAMRKAGNRRGSVFICPEAGHHLYMDNAPLVNQLLWDRLAPSDGAEGFPAAAKGSQPSTRRNSAADALEGFEAPLSPSRVSEVLSKVEPTPPTSQP